MTQQDAYHFLLHLEGLKKALEHGGGTHTIEDVLDQLEAGQAQLWTSADAVIVTELHDTPRTRVLHFWLATGELEAVVELSQRVLRWGKQQGCAHAELAGRKGWVRALSGEGWAPEVVVMRRDIP